MKNASAKPWYAICMERARVEEVGIVIPIQVIDLFFPATIDLTFVFGFAVVGGSERDATLSHSDSVCRRVH